MVWSGVVTTQERLIEHLLYINPILSVAIMFSQHRDSKAVWTWLLMLYFTLIFGSVLYLILCQDFRKSRMFRVKEVEDRLRYSMESQEEFLIGSWEYLSDPISRDFEGLVVYSLETSGAVLTVDNTANMLTDGEKKSADLRREMEKVTQYIYVQYYIAKNDEVFRSMIPILVKKAREGVEMRILYDSMGGRLMLRCVWDRLKGSGVKVRELFPAFLGRLQLRVNYRDHRKIVVVDGWIVYVDGFNVGKEYISKNPKFGHRRDTHLRISDGVVYNPQIWFTLGWNYATKENLFKGTKYLGLTDEVRTLSLKAEVMFQPIVCKVGQRPPGIQITTSESDSSIRQIRDNYLKPFHEAKRMIYTQTPYFIPNDTVLSTLQIAARVGVDVRLTIPCKPDHPFAYWATYSYMGDLPEADTRRYTYESGFLHTENVMIDSMVRCYGTANMDIRSFELNFKVSATICNEETTKQLEDIFLKNLENCYGMMESHYMRRSLRTRVKEQCSGLLSPLLQGQTFRVWVSKIRGA